MNSDLSSFGVANFTDHNHIRVLPENMAETIGEGEIDFWFDLHLPNAGELIFDGIFHGEDVSFMVV